MQFPFLFNINRNVHSSYFSSSYHIEKLKSKQKPKLSLVLNPVSNQLPKDTKTKETNHTKPKQTFPDTSTKDILTFQ